MAALTETRAKRAKPPASGYVILRDSDIKGLGLRVTANGAKSWVLRYSAGGRQSSFTIGAFPEWSAIAARTEAKRLRQLIDNDVDPLRERHARRAAPSVADLVEDYIETHLPKKRASSAAADRRLLEKHIMPALGKLKVANVSGHDIELLHARLSATPVLANRVLALTSKMMSLAVRWKWRADNPVKGIERYHEQPRQRYLTPDELERLSGALAASKSPVAADIVRLLLLTGARYSEVAQMRWADLDLDAGVWTKPSAHTKAKRVHRVPLSAPAVELLKGRRAGAEKQADYVFGNVRSIKTAWSRIVERAELDDVRIHDLRHTHASMMASDGASLVTIGAMLGHTQAQTTARYSHLIDDVLRDAAENVSRKLGHG